MKILIYKKIYKYFLQNIVFINLTKMKKYWPLIVIFFIGLCLRVIPLMINPCYIHDDAALAINIITHSSSDFFSRGLDFCQVAPPFFLLISKFMYNIMPPKYEMIDFGLKILPFISGIISIPLFYNFSNLIFHKKQQIYLANMIFCLNPLLICLCGRFKQYSTEVVIALLLYIFFYNYLTKKTINKAWYLLIIIAPWFSLSSLIILFSGFMLILLKDKLCSKPILYLLSFSILFFLIIFLPANMQLNYNPMNNFWSQYGFMSFSHPQRFLLRLGEYFLQEDKILKTLIGALIFYKMFEFIKNNKLNNLTLFVTFPIFISILLSFLHLYPFTDRLIAFLFPLFTIIITNFSDNLISKYLSTSFILISIICSVISLYNIYKLPNYRNQVEQYLHNQNINKDYKPFYPVYRYYTHLNNPKP